VACGVGTCKDCVVLFAATQVAGAYAGSHHHDANNPFSFISPSALLVCGEKTTSVVDPTMIHEYKHLYDESEWAPETNATATTTTAIDDDKHTIQTMHEATHSSTTKQIHVPPPENSLAQRWAACHTTHQQKQHNQHHKVQ